MTDHQAELQALTEVAQNTRELFSAGVAADLDKISQVFEALSTVQQRREKELTNQRDILKG